MASSAALTQPPPCGGRSLSVSWSTRSAGNTSVRRAYASVTGEARRPGSRAGTVMQGTTESRSFAGKPYLTRCERCLNCGPVGLSCTCESRLPRADGQDLMGGVDPSGAAQSAGNRGAAAERIRGGHGGPVRTFARFRADWFRAGWFRAARFCAARFCAAGFCAVRGGLGAGTADDDGPARRRGLGADPGAGTRGAHAQ